MRTFFMSMDGRYSARSQGGGAVMSIGGRYSAMSNELGLKGGVMAG